ncbi:hypothetical protein HYALB_00005912 [Hymenoscyphus albidus]|uniref:Phenol 2-monooxygenase n=1 Tax=Hymenoscyphus albidus TaxID=595503 RepID=A0A9N9LTG7_9HELO|nr:hypothetical protein HYALB_00005912 [Hymenoscyphus albidus]
MVQEPSKVDVLIVGAGPAGLMAAAWMARCGVNARIIDKRGTKIFSGQADGLAPRTLEIFDSFGFADRVWKESFHMIEFGLWNPDEEGVLRRADRLASTIPELSRFQPVLLHQGRIERFFLDHLQKHSSIKVERGVLPESLTFDDSLAEDEDAYPIQVTLQHLSEDEARPEQSLANGKATSDGLFRSNLAADDTDELLAKVHGNERAGTREVVKARYLVGCDGAHSWTRRQLGLQLEGEQTDLIWGVLDIIPITDFPDIRMGCSIHSADSGSVMVIPREKKLVRLYIQLSTVEVGDKGKLDRTNITPEMILECAQKIFAPYKLTYSHCNWWTAYQIGQRVCPSFHRSHRIFLAGDAVHTHSPKAGQGMNVSMQDTYNLGWKLASVVNGTCKRSLLETYQSERRRVAQDLIAFDHQLSRLFSAKPAKEGGDDHEGVGMDVFKDFLERGLVFGSGTAVEYGPSVVVAKEGDVAKHGDGTRISVARLAGGERLVGKPWLASGIKVGVRMPSFQVLNQADARPWPFQQLLRSDGRFRVVVFAGDVLSEGQMGRVRRLGERLLGVLRSFTMKGGDLYEVFDVLTVHSATRTGIEFLDFPEALRPFAGEMGWDYDKIFVDGPSHYEGDGRAYEGYGVGPEGCLVVLRPDQHVGFVSDLEDVVGVERYFGEFMVRS